MTPPDLDALEKLHANTSPGEWRDVRDPGYRNNLHCIERDDTVDGGTENVAELLYPRDAAFIVAACAAFPELLRLARRAALVDHYAQRTAVVEAERMRLVGEVEELKAEVKRLKDKAPNIG